MLVLSVGVVTQTSAAPEIEAASVKPGQPGKAMTDWRTSPMEFNVENWPLRPLIMQAFGVKSYQVLGLSEELSLSRWSVTVRSTEPASSQEWSLMLQSVLAERFRLRSHRERRALPVYALTVRKGGPKLKRAEENEQQTTEEGEGELSGSNIAIADLALMLTSELDRPVIDQTRLTGQYDFRLEWGEDAEPSGIFGVINRQLGLELKPDSQTINVLVIDHVERASPN